MPNHRKPRRSCRNCRKECSNPIKVYCNNTCQMEYHRGEKLRAWLKGEWVGVTGEQRQLSDIIRNYLITKSDNRCQSCGWSEIHPVTNRVPLQIDHADGNPENNHPSNLRVLCPNCHSLTPHWGNLNKGRGREARRRLRQSTRAVV
jgi:hypothetical protein